MAHWTLLTESRALFRLAGLNGFDGALQRGADHLMRINRQMSAQSVDSLGVFEHRDSPRGFANPVLDAADQNFRIIRPRCNEFNRPISDHGRP
jgi:hypothetical protein